MFLFKLRGVELSSLIVVLLKESISRRINLACEESVTEIYKSERLLCVGKHLDRNLTEITDRFFAPHIFHIFFTSIHRLYLSSDKINISFCLLTHEFTVECTL